MTLRPTSFASYIDRISTALEIRFAPRNPYKLCDIKPALGLVHADDLKDSDWWGFGDHDVIYGNLRQFLPETILQTKSLISCHDDQVSGHLAFLRNAPQMTTAFRRAKGWRQAFEEPDFCGFDEHPFSTLTFGYKRLPNWARQIQRTLDPIKRRCLFVEQHSTILTSRPWWNGRAEHPTHWCWKDGRLTNKQDGSREFMYLHFMNFKSSRYLPAANGPAAWQGRSDIVHISANDAAAHGFCITPQGFVPPTRDA